MGKKILRKLSLGLLTCLLLPACAGEEEAMQGTLPREGGTKTAGEEVLPGRKESC